MNEPVSNAGTGGAESDLHGSVVDRFAKDNNMVALARAGLFNKNNSQNGSDLNVVVPHN